MAQRRSSRDVEICPAAWGGSLENAQEHTVEYRIRRYDGEYRWLLDRAKQLKRAGEFVGYIGTSIDVTEHKASEATKDALVHELNHRVNNILAAVLSLSRMTFRQGTDLDEGRRRFEGRIAAMARLHRLLSSANWQGAAIQDVVAMIASINPNVADRVVVVGSNPFLSPAQVQSLVMALQEMLANASEFGSLSQEGGSVRVTIDVSGENQNPELELRWEEIGGPPVRQPKREGFGTRLIKHMLPREIQGQATLMFNAEGVVFSLRMPI